MVTNRCTSPFIFRDLLHDLEKCNADPVAIAECFVSKVKLVSHLFQVRNKEYVAFVQNFTSSSLDVHACNIARFEFLTFSKQLDLQ